MRRPQGYAVTTEADGKVLEEDTFTCGHCNTIVFVQPRQNPSEMGGFCRMCMGHTCATCAGIGTCEPFEKKMEAMERRDRLRRSILG